MTDTQEIKLLKRQVSNLEAKVDTCFFFKSLYRAKLARALRKLRDEETKYTRLALCHRHRQEAQHVHYAESNCAYCKLQSVNKDLKKQIREHEE